ncbi:helix-turn-helix domain-containing protein [Paenibacillus sp. NRS-1760]|uniref:response regulator n=1 Tax=Paenibacillus sp. NRS-1760 TaxID=3233902 RepID=UPI003D2E6E5B
MWKVIIAEDEPFVRRMLIKKVKWEALGFRIIGEAANGREALELMRVERPDLVISDIMMPIMDGLELLKQSREDGMASRFVMLTCMNEFEYARQALELGAIGYILKASMSIPSLTESLIKISKDLQEEKTKQQEWNALKFQAYYEQLWTYATLSKEAAPPIHPFLFEKEYTKVRIKLVLHGEAQLPEYECLDKRHESVIHYYGKEGLMIIFEWLSEGRTLPAGHDDAGFGNAGHLVHRSEWVLAAELPNLMMEQLNVLTNEWYGNAPLLLSKPYDRTYSLAWSMEKNILAAMEQVKREELYRLIHLIWEELQSRKVLFSIVREAAGRLDESLGRISGVKHVWHGRLKALTHEALREEWGNRMETHLEKLFLSKGEWSEHPEINKVMRHVQEHYAGNLTLKSVAKLVSIEEHYLSRLFTQKTGSNLISYIQRVRLEKAKRLLEETQLPIGEIGASVGLQNDNYFVKLFKKWYGETPGSYRRRQQEAKTYKR